MARREQMRLGEVRAVGVGKTRMVGRDGEARETQSEPERRVAQQARARRTVGNTQAEKKGKKWGRSCLTFTRPDAGVYIGDTR